MASSAKVLSINELHNLTRKPRNGKLQSDSVNGVQNANELWACLVETVRSPTVSDKHMTAACNALCFVVRSNAESEDEALNMKAYDQETWKQLFSAARSAFASGKNKPAIQILETLHYLAGSNPDRTSVVQNVEEAATDIVRIVLSHHPRRSLKEACIVLYFFLRKLSDYMSFSDVLNQALNHERTAFINTCHTSGIIGVVLVEDVHSQWFVFVLALLLAVRFTESKSATLKLLALLCGLPISVYQVDIPSLLSRSIDLYSVADEMSLEAVTRDVLPSVLTNQDLFSNFLVKQQRLGTSSHSAVLVVLTLLQYGKSKGYVAESVLPYVISKYWLSSENMELSDTSYDSFNDLLSHSSASIRLGTCELLLSSTSPNNPFPSGVLSCLTANLRYLHDDSDAYHRGELFSILRRFLTRLQQSHRVLENSGVDESQRDVLHEYDRFYDRYLSFLKRELSASNSYPRHILALQVLHLASAASSPESTLQKKLVIDQPILVALFQLVLDPYEDVRALAAETIGRIAQKDNRQVRQTTATLNPLTTVSRLAATTNRADHADALGRILSLIPTDSFNNDHPGYQEIAIQNLSHLSEQLSFHVSHLPEFNISDDFPMHGVILGVKYAIEKLIKGDTPVSPVLVQTLLNIGGKIWSLSQCHLCVDSPEMESESTENDDSGPKDRLAYAWRALRDSNLMMQAMLEHFPPDFALLERIGSTCLNQLALLRHRGAFSTVAQTFILCCQKARESKSEDSRNLIDRWSLEAMDELERQADKLTRRSAGLPAMFAAVFDPVDKAKFSDCFQQLVEKAVEPVKLETVEKEDKLRLPQVHALNCIKEIMTSSRFRVLTEPLVVFTLNLAANCMNSSTWTIKNCGLMLLRASINRLDPDTGLGNSEAGMKQRALSETQRRPVDVAVDFLHGSSTGSWPELKRDRLDTQSPSAKSTEALFAGLDIISRLYIEIKELDSIKRLVAEELGHPLWHIRAQAARLLTILIPHGMELELLRELLPESTRTVGDEFNRIHGMMMLTECLALKRRAIDTNSTSEADMIQLLHQTFKNTPIASNSTCMAIWLAVADQLLGNMSPGHEHMKDLLGDVELAITHPLFPLDQGNALYERHLALFGLRCYTLFGTMFEPTISLLQSHKDDLFTYALTNFRPNSSTRSTLRYIEVLTSLLKNELSQQRNAAVMHAFTTNVAQANIDIDAPILSQFVAIMDFKNPFSRDLLNTQIVFYSSLCRLAWISNNTLALDSLASLAGGFCLSSRFAANDEIEYDTRYSTINAFKQWSSVPKLRRMLEQLLNSVHLMDVLSVLDDLLNDDDEDIRAEAAEFAAAFMEEQNETSMNPARFLCPAASRHQLRIYLRKRFGATHLLRDECMRRILGQKMIVSRLRLGNVNDRYLRLVSVEFELRPIFEAMRELFVEEKQNLYVDEIAELEAWAFMLSKTSFSDDPTAMDRLSVWSVDGAEQLNAIFGGRHHWSSSLFDIKDDGEIDTAQENRSLHLQARVMFGTSLTENLELLVCRVVVGLRISRNNECAAYKLLHENCVRLKMSQAVLAAFTWSLR